MQVWQVASLPQHEADKLRCWLPASTQGMYNSTSHELINKGAGHYCSSNSHPSCAIQLRKSASTLEFVRTGPCGRPQCAKHSMNIAICPTCPALTRWLTKCGEPEPACVAVLPMGQSCLRALGSLHRAWSSHSVTRPSSSSLSNFST